MTACSEKHSTTANVRSAIGIGKEKAPRRPTWAPASARGKLGSQVTSTIQAGRPVAATRPGRPMPAASDVRSVSARKASNLVGCPRCQTFDGVSGAWSSLPAM